MRVKRTLAWLFVIMIISVSAYVISQSSTTGDTATNVSSSEGQTSENVDIVSVDATDRETYGELGTSYIEDGDKVIALANDLDCEKFEYEWEPKTPTCEKVASQLEAFGKIELTIGDTLNKLTQQTATRTEIADAIAAIDELILSYDNEIISYFLEEKVITDNMRASSNNKQSLQALLNSN